MPTLRPQGLAQLPVAQRGLPPRSLPRHNTKSADKSRPGSRPFRLVAPDFPADRICPTGPMCPRRGSARLGTTGGKSRHETLATIATAGSRETNINVTAASLTALVRVEITEPLRLRVRSGPATWRPLIGAPPMLGSVSPFHERLAAMWAAMLAAMRAVMRAATPAVLPTGAESLCRVDTIMRRQLTEMVVLTAVRRRGRGELLKLRVGRTRDLPGSLLFRHHCRHLHRRLRRRALQSIPIAPGS